MWPRGQPSETVNGARLDCAMEVSSVRPGMVSQVLATANNPVICVRHS